jgi:hypothetical protein
MSLKDKIVADVKEAMKAKDQLRLDTLRMAHAAIKNREIEVRPNEISEEEVTGVLKKIVKQRKDSIEQYKNAGRPELADKEQSELNIIESYLPKQMSQDAIEKLVVQVIQDLKADSMKQMGAVMKEVIARAGGTADGSVVSQLVKAKLT